MGKKKQTLHVPLSMVQLLITLWMVYQCTQAHFQPQFPERKETAQGFQHETNGDFKTVTEFNGCAADN
jgi:hypothetical protein